jgi:hypothetical protein
MNFKINGVERQLEFGMKFINVLDRLYQVSYQGMQFGMGVNMAYMYLQQYNPSCIPNIVIAALSHEKNKVTTEEIEAAMVEFAIDNDGLEKLFEELSAELGNSPLLKATIKRFQQQAKTTE